MGSPGLSGGSPAAGLAWPLARHRRAVHRNEPAVLEGRKHRLHSTRVVACKHERGGNRAQHRAEPLVRAGRQRAERRDFGSPRSERAGDSEGVPYGGDDGGWRRDPIPVRAGRSRAGCRGGGRLHHLGKGRDPGDGFGRELPERVGDRTDQAAVDVHRASAHPRDDAGLCEGTSAEAREDQITLRAHDVAQDAEDLDLELLDGRALEHRPADTDHAGPNLVDWHDPARRGQREEATAPRNQNEKKAVHSHGLQGSWLLRGRQNGVIDWMLTPYSEETTCGSRRPRPHALTAADRLCYARASQRFGTHAILHVFTAATRPRDPVAQGVDRLLVVAPLTRLKGQDPEPVDLLTGATIKPLQPLGWRGFFRL